jgi:hypothetical protein
MNALALITAAVLVIAGIVYVRNISTTENFWMTPSRSVKVEKMFRSCNKPDFFQIPNYQSMLSPRFSNVGYGTYLQGQMPEYGMLGVPRDPLMNTASSYNTALAQENRSCSNDVLTALSPQNKLFPTTSKTLTYDTGNSCQKLVMTNPSIEPYCNDGWQSTNIVGAPGVPLNPHSPNNTGYTNGNFDQAVSLAVDASPSLWPTSTVAEANRATLMSDDGQIVQPIIYDRYIYANKNSRQRGAGDPIRGDLPIVPVSGSWFIPSQASSPGLNLQQGAMNVMGGVNNETNNALANLIWNSSGGTETTIGGIDMAKTMMSHQVYGAAAAAQGDVMVTSFP